MKQTAGVSDGTGIDQSSATAPFDVASWEKRIERAATENKATMQGGNPDRDDEIFIAGLAALDPLTYQQQRKKAAKALDVTVGALDKLVRAAQPSQPEPSLFLWWEVEPSSQPADAERLITDIIARIRSHVIMTDEAATIVALWVVMTWVHDQAAVHSPILLVTSPEPNSGKTTLLGVISFLVRRSLQSVGVSTAALYRAIEKWKPTLIVDEADVAFVDNEDLRGAVNSGWTRGSGVLRCDGENNEPYLFSTFCPKALGMKGRKLPDTTMSRAIVIEMARKKSSERALDFQYVDDERLAELRSGLARFATDNADRLRGAQQHAALPEGFENRRAANWRLLLAIADTAGEEWARKARAAAERIAGTPAGESVGVDLLAHIKKVFDAHDADSILSRQLVDLLIADPEARWVEWGRDRKPMTQKQLGGLLREFHIISATVHPSNQPHGRGYRRVDFEEAWGRYLPPEAHAHAPIPPAEVCKCASADEMGITSTFRSVCEIKSAHFENANLSNNHAGLHTCTLREPESGPARVSAPPIATAGDLWKDLSIPGFLDRSRERLGPPAISAGPDDDVGDLEW
jgi:putative DNA primase/helicase